MKILPFRQNDQDPQPVGYLDGSCGDFALAIAGEASYQPAIRKARRQVTKDNSGRLVIAVLVRCEPTNPHDENAVRVSTLVGDTLGYLSRENAQVYCAAISAIEQSGRTVRCNATFYGGDQARPTIGVWLDLKSPADLLP